MTRTKNITSLTVEVVLCTFNGARFVGEQLKSILMQSQQVNQITVYDDGSTDDTLTIVQEFADQAIDAGIRLKIVCNERNFGYAQNFGQGLLRATGDIIFFSDQDDVWNINKVAYFLKEFEDVNCNLVFSDGVLIDSEGKAIKGNTVLQRLGISVSETTDFSSQGWKMLLRYNYLNGAAMAIRRLPALEALPIPEGYPHDYWLALWLSRSGRGICLQDSLYKYRLHESNTIGAANGPLRYQLASIWRNPNPPRRLDLHRTRTLIARLPIDDVLFLEATQKLAWLESVVEERRRLYRLQNIATSYLRGDYARFAAPFAFLRDLVSVLRRSLS